MIRLLVIFGVAISLAGCVATRHGKLPPPQAEPAAAPQGRNAAKTAPYEVFGQRYYPVTDSTGYRERGVASWYGGKFHGRPTANGERYDMYQYTAAHKTLPLPTWVRVTNLRNGNAVTVRVNDRGPFVKNRLIDLSYAAAEKLGMVGDGTTLVEVEAIDSLDADSTAIVSAAAAPPPGRPAPEPRPAIVQPVAAQPEPAPAAASGGPATAATLYIQVGAFGDLANARRMRTTLYNAGIGDVRLSSAAVEGTDVHRVQIGPVPGVLEYDAMMARLDALGISDTHLVTD